MTARWLHSIYLTWMTVLNYHWDLGTRWRNEGRNWYTITVMCWMAIQKLRSPAPALRWRLMVQNVCASHSSLFRLRVWASRLFGQTVFSEHIREMGVMMFARFVFTPHCCRDLKALTQDKSNLPDIWLRIIYELCSLTVVHWEEGKIWEWVLITSCQFFRHVRWVNTSLSFFLS